jgi:hypothetical protein
MYASLRMPLLAALLTASVLGGSGCYNTILMSSEDAHVTTLSSGKGEWFEVRTSNNFKLWGNYPRMRVFLVDQVVSAELGRDVKRIDGLRVMQKATFMNGLISTITLGIYTPRTLIIQGTIPKDTPHLTNKPDPEPDELEDPYDTPDPDPAPAPAVTDSSDDKSDDKTDDKSDDKSDTSDDKAAAASD